MELAQLDALAAAIDGGSFDAAAASLNITPSAVSQRIKALESSVGSVLVQRTKPTEITDAGRPYLRLARQIDALVVEAQTGGEVATIPLAVSSDALASWVMPALAALPRGFTVDVRREDQDHSADLLRAGTVMAAITSDAVPVQGCTSVRLGTMRYRPMASPGFAREWFPRGGTLAELAAAPVVVFDRKDDLQDRYLRLRSSTLLAPPRHHIPGSAEFVGAVRSGMGWGMLPDQQTGRAQQPGRAQQTGRAQQPAAAGDWVEFDTKRHLDVVLYWQQWSLRTPGLDAVSRAISDAAASTLI